ncbi:NAD(P)H-dependent oxidoreductase [Alteromonas sp. ASW11-36]|uniref:FMN dependent NADH:quinone oxidoreductase n=1 Tax=Alteromonas arenosi TaxID=3055817 RepID=A0ABT7SYZ6_9ALTE|nr:NAD(P)H-dependent oxidoreductase [Alteromonas sp. ASW11-36]MDM7860759.1 NAD(P)H-dependent oxidoreductase [Alteromonas sp. ASW11-36]
MKNVLAITSSLQTGAGNSTKLVDIYLDKLATTTTTNVVRRDLAATDIPHLTDSEMAAWAVEPTARNDEQQQLAQLSEDIIAEVQTADEIVLGVPMYNFGIPSALKAWIDRLARAGITFTYTENGPQGLLNGKKVTILAARGGMYAGTALDTQTEYLRNFWAFLGVTDVEFVYAEGLAMGEESAQQAWQKADEKILELIAN